MLISLSFELYQIRLNTSFTSIMKLSCKFYFLIKWTYLNWIMKKSLNLESFLKSYLKIFTVSEWTSGY